MKIFTSREISAKIWNYNYIKIIITYNEQTKKNMFTLLQYLQVIKITKIK